MTDDESEAEETVMLTRRDRRRGRAVAASPTEPTAPIEPTAPTEPETVGGPADDVDEATVVVDRSSARSDEPADALDGEREQELVDESTVLVSRTPRRVRRKRSERQDEQGDASGDSAPAADASAEHSSFEAPTDAPAPEIYRPRPAPLGPSAPPVVVGAAAPTRAVDPELPSVAKQGLRWSTATLLAFAAACVVSVAGLVTLGFVILA
ncbi:hypothetical protein [Microbacterium sp. APC 3901]|uniref:hypothetical protein n=1 Tax=Microbacterium sp. APC 3901 TaxID=3035192 RepID=UPI0025B2AB49|nr:hypothetical protein [Microbacterium sp. APC 3901]MDN3444203.1 hypothetical protein [Microbacterium sp. APC 3901]